MIAQSFLSEEKINQLFDELINHWGRWDIYYDYYIKELTPKLVKDISKGDNLEQDILNKLKKLLTNKEWANLPNILNDYVLLKEKAIKEKLELLKPKLEELLQEDIKKADKFYDESCKDYINHNDYILLKEPVIKEKLEVLKPKLEDLLQEDANKADYFYNEYCQDYINNSDYALLKEKAIKEKLEVIKPNTKDLLQKSITKYDNVYNETYDDHTKLLDCLINHWGRWDIYYDYYIKKLTPKLVKDISKGDTLEQDILIKLKKLLTNKEWANLPNILNDYVLLKEKAIKEKLEHLKPKLEELLQEDVNKADVFYNETCKDFIKQADYLLLREPIIKSKLKVLKPKLEELLQEDIKKADEFYNEYCKDYIKQADYVLLRETAIRERLEVLTPKIKELLKENIKKADEFYNKYCKDYINHNDYNLLREKKIEAKKEIKRKPRNIILQKMPKPYNWQSIAIESWEKNNKKGIVEAVTGSGKTMIGLVATLKELKFGGKVLILVPSIVLLEQWQEQLELYIPFEKIGVLGGGFKDSFANKDVIVATVNSARNTNLSINLPKDRSLLIADECHRYGSEKNSLVLASNFSFRLGLSATYERNDNRHIEKLLPYFEAVVYTLDYKKALEEKVVSNFILEFVGVNLSYWENKNYNDFCDKAYNTKKELIKKYGVEEEPFGVFIKQVQELSKDGEDEVKIIAKSYLNAFYKKREILASADDKVKQISNLIDDIKRSNRTIVFTQTIRATEGIVKTLKNYGIKCEGVHSRQEKKERNDNLNKFKNNEIKVIVAPKVLDEGLNVPSTDLGIIVSASLTRRQMIQRMGRVLRKEQNKKIAKFIVMYAKETSEDPKNGAHETFIQEATEVADSVSYR